WLLRSGRLGAFVAASVFITGCGGQSERTLPQGATAQLRVHAHPLSSGDLLYVSDGAENVLVFSYPQGAFVRRLTGVPNPGGECCDSQGNVFITDQAANEVFEYEHGGSTPINTLHTANLTPFSCSVDPLSGDLAVVSDYGSSGYLEIFKQAQG